MKFSIFFATAATLAASTHAFAPSIQGGQSGSTTTTIQQTTPIQYLPISIRSSSATKSLGSNISPSQRCPPSALFMGWGPEPEWSPASILSTTTASSSGKFVSVSVEVPSSVLEEYKVPGQYVQVKQTSTTDANAKPLFLAIASPPLADVGGVTNIEFLVKKTDNNAWITDAKEGTSIDISQVMGKGFPIQEECEGYKYDFPLQNCLMFANGSGIAPIRAAIESGQLKIAKPGMGGRTARLYFGCSTPADMPYISKFKEWEANGVEVVPVISQPENCQGQWTGRTGYVQTCLEEDGVPIPRNTGALLCGVKGMAESVKALLTKAGVFEGRVMTNF